MYGWIWRHLPFGLPGKIAGSLLLAAGSGVLLWFVVFPAVEPVLWFGDVQVSQSSDQDGGGATPAPAATPDTAPTSINPSDYVIPYSTVSNNTGPTRSPSRR